MRIRLNSKINTRVDSTCLYYDGSITIPSSLMTDADICPNEQVHVLNINTGGRYITYAIPGDNLCINGALARKFMIGDEIIILSYEITDKAIEPRIIKG